MTQAELLHPDSSHPARLKHLGGDFYACPRCDGRVSIPTANGICARCQLVLWPDGRMAPANVAWAQRPRFTLVACGTHGMVGCEDCDPQPVMPVMGQPCPYCGRIEEHRLNCPTRRRGAEG